MDRDSDPTLRQVPHGLETAPTGQHDLTPTGKTAYELRDVLGKGGMGEVVLARDSRIGRDVALKRMRGEPDAAMTARFLREAKIQARLDHPAIVPVHEIGRDSEGLPYFTMKRLAGTTLATMLQAGGATQQRQLRAVAEVCLAIAFAHERGVVHRDLKPSNIMLGEYGEVYVIDWGVALLLGEQDVPTGNAMHMSSSNQTGTGQILGTPGYMAPEQISAIEIGPPADVYALGAILFELLAGEPLHPRGTAALGSTLAGAVDASPARRNPTRAVPPELDTTCVAALAQDPKRRPTARELGEQIQNYLDGDRDVERRRTLAAQLVVEGRAALAAGDRAGAVRSGGRALALDPGSTDAAGLVMSLVLGPPPKEVPDEVAAAMATNDEVARRERSRRALFPYGAFFLLSPAFALFTVESWPQLIAVFATVACLFTIALVHWRTGKVPSYVSIVFQVAAIVVLSRLSSPFVLTPVMIAAMIMSASAIPWFNERPLAVLAYTTVLVMTPFALEALGLLPESWSVVATGITIDGTVFESTGGAVSIGLIVGNLVLLLVIAIYARGVTRDRRQAQLDMNLRAWLFRQLLPITRKA